MDKQTFLNQLPQEPSPEQLAVIGAPLDTPLSVIAGAGSGKSTTLISRLLYMHYVKDVAFHDICCLTFSRLATTDMKAKFNQLNANFDLTVAQPQFSTLHAIFFKALRASGVVSHQVSVGQITDFMTELRNDIKFRRGINYYDTLNDYYEIYSSCVNANQLAKAFDKNYLKENAVLPTAFSFAEYQRVIEHYQTLKQANNVIDFDDMQVLLLKALKNPQTQPKIATWLAQQFKYLFIDEYQDTSYLQQAILDNMGLDYHHVMVIGDPHQAIYRFRGSSATFLMQFAKKHHGKQLALTVNYRCPQNILQPVLSNLPDSNDTAFNKGGTLEFTTTRISTDTVKQYVADKQHTTAIIAPTHANLALLLDKCVANNIGIAPLDDKFSLDTINYYRDIITTIDAFVNLNETSLIRMVYKIFGHLKINTLTKRNVQSAPHPFEYIKRTLRKELDGKRITTQVNTTAKNLDKLSRESSTVTDKFSAIIELLEPYHKQVVKNGYETQETLDMLNEYLAHTIVENKFTTLSQFTAWRDKIDTQLHRLYANHNSYNVVATTVHATKGLEFDRVYFVGSDDILSVASASAIADYKDYDAIYLDLLEKRNLFYVGWTRAKQTLIVEHHHSQANISPFTRNIKNIKELTKGAITYNELNYEDYLNHAYAITNNFKANGQTVPIIKSKPWYKTLDKFKQLGIV